MGKILRLVCFGAGINAQPQGKEGDGRSLKGPPKRNPVRRQEWPADMDGKGMDWTGVLVQKKGTHTPAKGDKRSTARKEKKIVLDLK
jgi:hypothetical protein